MCETNTQGFDPSTAAAELGGRVTGWALRLGMLQRAIIMRLWCVIHTVYSLGSVLYMLYISPCAMNSCAWLLAMLAINNKQQLEAGFAGPAALRSCHASVVVLHYTMRL